MRVGVFLVALLVTANSSWAMDKDDFADYIRALKAHDYAGFSKYYSVDFRFYPGGGRALDRDETIAYERELAAMTNWTMDVRRVIADETGIVMEAVMDIEYINDPPPGVPNPIEKGTRVTSHFVAVYALNDGMISELRFFLTNDPDE
jgi:SnoaL-like domain